MRRLRSSNCADLQPSTQGLEKLAKLSRKRAHVSVAPSEESKSDDEKAVSASAFLPSNWKHVLENIRRMRQSREAPVDSMGAHKCADPNASQQDFHFHVLVALLLSSQTKDQVTSAAMAKLRARGLTVDNVLETDSATLEDLIKPVGFYKKKVDYLKRTAQVLKEEHNGDIPCSIEDLCKLPGIGPKMAHLCMDIAWNRVTGIGVDTHVHRIVNRLNWVEKPTKNPEQTRLMLESWIPRELWSEINWLLVGFGQQTCLPVNPRCGECLNSALCPYARQPRKGTQKM